MILSIITTLALIWFFAGVLLMAFTDDRRKRIALVWWIGAMSLALAVLHWAVAVVERVP